MADRPILFSAPMVRALLDGRKTQTRRLAQKWKEPPKHNRGTRLSRVGGWVDTAWRKAKPGDRLWVRETLVIHNGFGRPLAFGPQVREGDNARVWSYAADNLGEGRGWPAIHMPRAYSRLTLTVTDVRVERLQEISYDDAKAEGIEQRWTCLNPGTASYAHDNDVLGDFRSLWQSINGAGAWDANPWVVALTFTVERRNIDA